MRKAIEATGAELRFLPTYSPDFNPIEMAFSKLKAFLKKLAPRTVYDLCRRSDTPSRPSRPMIAEPALLLPTTTSIDQKML